MITILGVKLAHYGRRLLVFQLIGVLIAVGILLVDGIHVVAPWLDLSEYSAPLYAATLQRWHDARWGAHAGILCTGSLLALLWRPRAQPLLLQFLICAAIMLVAIEAPFAPFQSLLHATIVALLAIAYPDRAALLQYRPLGQSSRPLLALSLLVATLLALDIWRSLPVNLTASGSHLLAQHTIEASALALAGLLAATRRPGWQALGLLTGATLIYLGLVAAKLSIQPHAWGATSAALATLVGWAFVGLTAWEARRAGKQSAKWNSATSLMPK
jgi:hypothetical protein